MAGINVQLLDNIAFKVLIEKQEYIEHFKPEYFDEKIKQNLFRMVKDHFKKFSNPPTKEQLKEINRINSIDTYDEQQMQSNFIDILYSIDLNQYTKDWLEKAMESYIAVKQLDHSVKNLIVYLKTTPIKMDNVDVVLADARKIITDGTEINFNIDTGKSIFDPSSYKAEHAFKITSGFNFIDTVTGGGFSRPGLHIMMGPAKSGKTIWLGNIAIEMIKTGMNGAFISLEMPEYAMLQRFGPNLFNVPMKTFEDISQNPYEVGKLIQGFRSQTSFGESLFDPIHPGELILKEFPTSTATTIDIHSFIKRVNESLEKPLAFVIIDYINIMANWRNPNTDNTYLKVKQIAEDLRAISQQEGVAIISATQTKAGNEDSSDFGSGAVAESSGLNHTVDSEFGIIQTAEMYTNREYYLKVLLNRHGGMKFARKRFNINYDIMRLTETNDPIIEESDYNI